jgi:hypothetical protein
VVVALAQAGWRRVSHVRHNYRLRSQENVFLLIFHHRLKTKRSLDLMSIYRFWQRYAGSRRRMRLHAFASRQAMHASSHLTILFRRQPYRSGPCHHDCRHPPSCGNKAEWQGDARQHEPCSAGLVLRVFGGRASGRRTCRRTNSDSPCITTESPIRDASW